MPEKLPPQLPELAMEHEVIGQAALSVLLKNASHVVNPSAGVIETAAPPETKASETPVADPAERVFTHYGSRVISMLSILALSSLLFVQHFKQMLIVYPAATALLAVMVQGDTESIEISPPVQL